MLPDGDEPVASDEEDEPAPLREPLAPLPVDPEAPEPMPEEPDPEAPIPEELEPEEPRPEGPLDPLEGEDPEDPEASLDPELPRLLEESDDFEDFDDELLPEADEPLSTPKASLVLLSSVPLALSPCFC